MLTRIISVTAAVVVFVTTYALVLPAITMETEAQCGIEAHQHSDECYTDELVCEIPESPGHVHTDACYEVSQVLVCETPEHEHSVENGCYDEDGNLICELADHHHAVEDGCYKEVKELVCDIPESEGHTHDSSCYKKVLTCGKEVHTHSTACYHIDAANKAATEAAAVASTESAGVAGTESMMSTMAATGSGETAFTDVLPVDEIDESNTGTAGTSTTTDAKDANTASTDVVGEELGSETGIWTPAEETVDPTASETDGGAIGSTTSASSSVSSTSTTSSASATASTTEKASEENAGYVPVLDELNIPAVLNDLTGIYCYRPESDPAVENNETSAGDSEGTVPVDNNTAVENNNITITADDHDDSASTMIDVATIPAEDWHRIPNNTEDGEIPELEENDLLRVYWAYTIPAGSLNETNTIARYRLPANIRLTDDQIDTINSTVNGIAAQYVNMDTLEILDVDQYNASLGIEAVEGTRTPDQDIQDYLNNLGKSGKEASEYINATVRVENIFNEDTGDYEGQDLVFAFTPYSILKNQHEYDKDGQPTKAGEELQGWVSLDLTTDQIEWTTTGTKDEKDDKEAVEKTARIVFVERDKELEIVEISTELKLVEKTAADDSPNKKAEGVDTVDSDEATGADETEAVGDEEKEANKTEVTENEKIVDNEESVAESEVNYPSVSFDDSITVTSGSLSTDTAGTGAEENTEITVHVEADEDTFPEGTTMRLAAVTDDQMEAVTEAVEGVMAEAAGTQGTSGHTQGFHALDISFWNADGVEIEPLKPIRVSMTSEAIKRAVEDSATAPVVVHVEDGHTAVAGNSAEEDADTSEESVVEPADDGQNVAMSSDSVTVDDAETDSMTLPTASIIETATGETKKENADTLSFEAGTFSVYAIVYTVDFHYEVNGKMYEFSIPGGGFASFYKIVEVLGISNPGTQSGSGDEIETENGEIGAENGENTDGNAVHNVVEETGVEDTGTYSDAVSLNNVEVSEATKKFVADVANVEFSSPDLVWVGKVDEETTVGGLKEANELEVQYSAELTEEQIAEINSSTVEGGDWALISLIPFTSEESLTVTMKNGDQFVVKVTDAQEVTSPEATEIDINKAYMICYDDGENYHILHNDGSQDSISKGGFPYVVEYYVSNTTWAFQYVFKEYDREGTEGYNYYLIRSNDDISSTLAIYEEGTEGTELVQPSNNNIALLPAEGGGFYLSGYNGYRLAFEDGKFISKKYNEGDPDTGSVMHIFERETLPQYMLNVSTNNPERGVVWCYYPTQVLDGDAVELGYTFRFDDYATTELYKRFDIMSDSGNESGTVRHIAQDLYAFPWGERGLNNTYRYKFDYWELNGEHLDPDEYPEMIPAGKLEVPYNGSTLIAHFVYDDTFQATDDQKTDSHVDDMSSWLSDFQARRVPLDETKTQKTAEVYDYENRIYRVDLTTKSNLRTFDGSIDLGFSLDVSNSMLFPADLQPYENLSNVQLRTSSGRNRLDTSKTYYIISDRKNRSTVFKIFYSGGSWRYTDASKNESNVIGSTTSFHAVADDNYDNNYTYQMYYANPDSTGVVRDRFYYLNQSLTSITDDLVNIKNTLNIAGANSPSVKAGYNTFNGFVQNGTTWTINGNRVTQGNDRRTLSDVAKITPHFENVAGGGTRPDRAIEDANNLGWTGDTRYLILITDGAPQGGYYDHSNESTDPSAIRGWVRDKAKAIKKSEAEGGKDVKIITIGLSMNDVDEGRKLLYDIADYAPNNGPKMFYLAEKTKDLSNILRQILDLILVDATVEGDITDTVNEAFYLVDKATGLPLQANDTIDIDGNKTSDSTKVAGTVLADGKTVKWNDQIIDNKNGWHGVVYVKAKEDLIGANAVKTNDPDHPAEFVAERYFTSKSTTRKNFDASETEKLVTRVINQASPRVNVNELTFPATDTEWTVYLGTQVDPKKQLKLLYEGITVEEVINQDSSLHFPLSENNLSDDREGAATGTAQTFRLAPVILEIIRNDAALRAKYIVNNALNWDAFLADIMTENGVAVPYHPYGIEGTDSQIVISLTKEILSGEEADLAGRSPHNTTVVNNTAEDNEGNPVDVPAEKYSLTVKYSPDYDHVLPKGQGGTSTDNFHTGAYGTGYQGHAAGMETSRNTHTINVYAEPLDVLKKDDHDALVPGAVFKLYRAARQGETGEPLSAYDASLTGSYYCISTAASGADGIAHLAPDDTTTPAHTIPVANGQTAQNLLAPLAAGETYYLVEYSAPSGYKKDTTVRKVTVEVGPDLFTRLDKTTPVENSALSGSPARPDIAYNWNEGVTIKVTELGDAANTDKAALVNHETRQAVTLDGGRTYMLRSDSEQAVVTQVLVINDIVVDIKIKKTDLNGQGLAGAVFQLKAVGDDGHSETDVEEVTGIASVSKTIDGEEKTFTSAFETTGEEQIIGGLPDGTYRLYEAYVPAGYISTFRYIQFTIENRVMKDVTTDSGTSDKAVPTAAVGNRLALLTIKNTPGAALPNTGGPGTTLIYLLGLLLTSFAGTGILMKRRRRNAA